MQRTDWRGTGWLTETPRGGLVNGPGWFPALEKEIQSTLTRTERKARTDRLDGFRWQFGFQDAYRDWCGERFLELDGGAMVLGTFTVRPGRFKSKPHALACVRKWARKVERFTLKGGSLEVHVVFEDHLSGELHVHVLLPSLPAWFRLSDWRAAWERWFPMAEESERSLTGVLGVRFRKVKTLRQARYAGKYVAKDLREGGDGVSVLGGPQHGMLFDVGRAATGADLVTTDLNRQTDDGAPASLGEP